MIKNKKNVKESGFVALVTATVLSFVLILVAVTLNQSGFFTRRALLDSEYKERSAALAEACADNALLRLAANPSYAGNELISIDGDNCQIRPIQQDVPAAGQITVEARAFFQEATTNLRIVVNTLDLSVVSWNEVPSF